jgi:hypothetical protein
MRVSQCAQVGIASWRQDFAASSFSISVSRRYSARWMSAHSATISAHRDSVHMAAIRRYWMDEQYREIDQQIQ